MLTYELDMKSETALYIQIYDSIKEDIENGSIAPMEKLPSKRALASQLGVSVITIENAYAQLIAEGYIFSVNKKGFFAEDILTHKNAVKFEAGKNVDGIWEKEERKKDFNPDKEMFPFSIWAKLMREELSVHQEELLTKPSFQGIWELRCAIARHLRQFRNMQVKPEQIVVGAGTEYLYMLIILLLGNDKIYGLEDPGYLKIASIYKSHKVTCAHIPMCNDGIDMEALAKSNADIVHISPSHHFPTGAITSIGKRYQLLKWASESDSRYIIEDDYDSEFRLSGNPISSLMSMDMQDKVIYMNTFSKSLASTIRISYLILPPKLLEKFCRELSFYSCTVPTFEQYTLARFIDEGYFEKHINRMRHYYKKKKEQLLESIQSMELFRNAKIYGENGGLHCVMEFDTNKNDEELVQLFEDKGFHVSAMKDYYAEDMGNTGRIIFFYV